MIHNREATKLKAVHDQDLEQFLVSLGLFSKVKNGMERCLVCGCPITLDNLGCVFPYEGEIKLCCGQLSCYNDVTKKRLSE